MALAVIGRAQDLHGAAITNDASEIAMLPDAPQAQATAAQQAPTTVAASVHGVVVNREGAVYEGAHVTLTQPGATSARTATTDGTGRFNFAGVSAGAFTLAVSAEGFATQAVTGTVQAGDDDEVKPIVLMMSSASSQVEVSATPAEIAMEEFKEEETQRVLGIVPNFYVSYVPNAPPLTARQKFSLAWRSSIDPVTLVIVGALAGQEQASNNFPGYGQGAQGFGKRYGAAFGDQFISGMIGGAILPWWWKQDPRYFYKGTGTIHSRAWYAIKCSVMWKGDNGRWQVGYSGIVGGFAAAGISNLYYPASSRNGVGLTFANVAVGTATSAAQNLFQEFVIRRLTPHVPNYGSGKP
jgi:hypothetical protein